MSDLEYFVKVANHAGHAERVKAMIASALKEAGYECGENGLVVAPKKVCWLISSMAVKTVAMLDELTNHKLAKLDDVCVISRVAVVGIKTKASL